jgi:hypothetical protein
MQYSYCIIFIVLCSLLALTAVVRNFKMSGLIWIIGIIMSEFKIAERKFEIFILLLLTNRSVFHSH